MWHFEFCVELCWAELDLCTATAVSGRCGVKSALVERREAQASPTRDSLFSLSLSASLRFPFSGWQAEPSCGCGHGPGNITDKSVGVVLWSHGVTPHGSCALNIPVLCRLRGGRDSDWDGSRRLTWHVTSQLSNISCNTWYSWLCLTLHLFSDL